MYKPIIEFFAGIQPPVSKTIFLIYEVFVLSAVQNNEYLFLTTLLSWTGIVSWMMAVGVVITAKN